jgi:hypothetical protein
MREWEKPAHPSKLKKKCNYETPYCGSVINLPSGSRSVIRNYMNPQQNQNPYIFINESTKLKKKVEYVIIFNDVQEGSGYGQIPTKTNWSPGSVSVT